MKAALELIILLPLSGAAFNLLIGGKLPRRIAEAVACTVIWGSFAAAAAAFRLYQAPVTVEVATWLSDFDFTAPLTLYLDPLSLSLCLMITFVCGLIHLYSIAYMADDPCYIRYFALLNLFVAAMLTLILAENLPLLYLGWEGVGFCSYALIGFWYRDEKNATAGRKAFIVTRIGDIALIIGIAWLFEQCGTSSITRLNALALNIPPETVTIIGLLLLAGAMGKSAQVPLMVWLPDAMAGPTPVSALIHAATMVTAGAYLLMRMFPVISASPEVLTAIAVTGAVTAFYGATCAVAQRDLKRLLAYSTISQVGYMILGVGAGSIVASNFHLIIHAFFKAALFLAAGCIITAMHHEQDIFRMGGLRKTVPRVFWPFLAGAVCLAGFPLTGGFFSKDGILEAVWLHGGGLFTLLSWIGFLTAFITAFYSFRMLYLVFGGTGPDQVKSCPRLMELVLIPLALAGLFGGLLNIPAYIGNGILATFLEPGQSGHPPHPATAIEISLQLCAAMVALAGAALAHFRYSGEQRSSRIREAASGATGISAFLLNGWYMDDLYRLLFIRPFQSLSGFLWKRVDEEVIDHSLDRFAALLGKTGQWLGSWGGGKVSTYILSMAAGAAAIVAWFAWVSP